MTKYPGQIKQYHSHSISLLIVSTLVSAPIFPMNRPGKEKKILCKYKSMQHLQVHIFTKCHQDTLIPSARDLEVQLSRDGRQIDLIFSYAACYVCLYIAFVADLAFFIMISGLGKYLAVIEC